MLPELANKIIKPISDGKMMDDIRVSAGKEKNFARSTMRNSRNSEILNSLICINLLTKKFLKMTPTPVATSARTVWIA